MFQSLSDRLEGVFNKLTGKGVLREDDVDAAMREVRVALLEADVALPVVKSFIEKVRERAVGQEVIRSVTPGQQVIKIVHDALVDLLGAEHVPLDLAATPPVVVLMVGLQGSGKTTSTGKLAWQLQQKQNKKVLLASLDVQRPAAREQLALLAEQSGAASLSIIAKETPLEITKRALKEAREGGFDVLVLDSAGRMHVDAGLMEEIAQVKKLAAPTETLLVADALTGQDAVNIARSFHEAVGVTGVILTRLDGDARGGAALSMREITGQPIKYAGMGEKIDQLEPFHPGRVADRILGMGDVVSLVERAAEAIDEEKAEAMAKKLERGEFDLNDLADQLRNLKKMGGIGNLMGMLPGMGAMQKQVAGQVDDKMLARQEAIILSMTPAERANPIKLLNGSRKRRIAAGAGATVQDVNRLMKQFQQMQGMMKMMKKIGAKKMMRSLGNLPGMGGGMGGLGGFGGGKFG